MPTTAHRRHRLPISVRGATTQTTSQCGINNTHDGDESGPNTPHFSLVYYLARLQSHS